MICGDPGSKFAHIFSARTRPLQIIPTFPWQEDLERIGVFGNCETFQIKPCRQACESQVQTPG